ncbi:MAG: MBL fold metallo-hydrolase, partial [Pseudomonadota bacterium]
MSAAFTEVADRVWVYANDCGPNSGVILGDDGIMVVDGQPNVAAAADLADRIAALGAGRVTSVALTHFHASRWAHIDVFPGAALITSRKCRTEMLHRGAGELEVAHLRDGVDVSPGGLTAPPDARLAFKSGLSVFLGGRKVEILHFGRGHTSGDAVVWVQDAGAMLTGDLVERDVTPFVGGAAAPE